MFLPPVKTLMAVGADGRCLKSGLKKYVPQVVPIEKIMQKVDQKNADSLWHTSEDSSAEESRIPLPNKSRFVDSGQLPFKKRLASAVAANAKATGVKRQPGPATKKELLDLPGWQELGHGKKNQERKKLSRRKAK